MAGPLRKTRSKASAPPPQRDSTLRLSRPMTVLAATALIAAVGWAFFMGFMVGRGQNPEARVEQMAGIFQPSRPAETPPQESPPQAPPQDPQSPPATPETPATPPPGSTAEKPAPSSARPTGQALEAWGHKAAAPAPADPGPVPGSPPRKEGTPARAAEAVPPLAQHDFVYQVAAFKNPGDAAKLRRKLEEKGLRAQVWQSGRLHMVRVRLRGSDNDASRLREELKRMNLGTPLLESKKSVTGRKNNR